MDNNVVQLHEVNEHKYILSEDGKPMPISNVHEWGRWYEKNRRNSMIHDWNCGVMVSTVFLALDHAFSGGPPILWETMIFSKRKSWRSIHSAFQRRYSTKEQAQENHKAILKIVKSGYSVSWIRKRLNEL